MTDMTGSIPEWIDLAGKARDKLRPPFKADVSYLRYDQTDNPPRSPVIFISPHPWRYFMTLDLVNVSSEVAFVKAITLSIDGGDPIQADLNKPIRLEPKEPWSDNIIFPLPTKGGIEEGKFTLEVVPSVGKTTVVSAKFPI